MTRFRPEVVFDGWYGRRNAGDDAFCAVAAEVARTRWGMERVAFVGPHAALPSVPIEAKGVYPARPRFRGHARLAPLRAMLRARTVVHVGGSTFTHRLARQRDEVRLARAGLIDLHAVGVSIGPFADDRAARDVAAVLRHFETVSVRDAASLARAEALDLPVRLTHGFDVAVLLSRPARPAGPTRATGDRQRPVLGVALCDDESSTGDRDRVEQRQARTRALVAEVVARTGATVRLLLFNDHPRWGDQRVTDRMAEDLSGTGAVEVVRRTADPRDLLTAVAGCDALLATRLHSAVFAFACEVPFAVVAYHRKCADFAAEVGLPDELVFPAGGPPTDADPAAIAALLSRPPPQLRPPLSLSAATDRAKRAFPDLSPRT